MLEHYVKKILASRVYDVAIETPLHEARSLSRASGNRVFLKREDLQPVFSFKLRGAYNKMAQLSAEDRARGVIVRVGRQSCARRCAGRESARHSRAHRDGSQYARDQSVERCAISART